MVLFGAGASYHSAGILPERPPLGVDLFSALQDWSPRWRGLWYLSADPFKLSFEQGMDFLFKTYPNAIQDAAPGIPSPHAVMQDLARFFLRYRLDGSASDPYSLFLTALSRAGILDRCGFATLNYEHLLEDAMCRAGLVPAVLRPHGGCQLVASSGSRVLIHHQRAMGRGFYSKSQRATRRTALEVERLMVPPSGMYPCMAAYATGKFGQVGLDYMGRIRARFASRVARAEVLVVIGAKPWPADTHVWKPLSDSPAPLLYVGGADDFNKWTRCARPCASNLWISDKFVDSIDALVEEMDRSIR